MSFDEKYDLAENPSTPVDVLRKLAKDTYEAVRWTVASNSNTPADVLQELAKDNSYTVRAIVADNPSTPENVLRALVKDKGWRIRTAVAENPKAPSNILVMLFEYEKNFRKPDSGVIQSLYYNKNLPTFAKRVIETLFGEMVK